MNSTVSLLSGLGAPARHTSDQIGMQRIALIICPGDRGKKVKIFFPLVAKFSVLVFHRKPMLLLDLLRLNLFLAQRVMVAGTIKIDEVIDILKHWLRRSQSLFAYALELRVAVTALG